MKKNNKKEQKKHGKGKYRLKLFLILSLNFVLLLCGISTAYYNTRSLAFDEQPVIASSNAEKYTFLDFTVYRSDLLEIKEQIESMIPKESIRITLII